MLVFRLAPPENLDTDSIPGECSRVVRFFERAIRLRDYGKILNLAQISCCSVRVVSLGYCEGFRSPITPVIELAGGRRE